MLLALAFFLFFFNDTATTEIYTLSLHDALPISLPALGCRRAAQRPQLLALAHEIGRHLLERSEEHTSELQPPCNLVCRLLLEKKKKSAMHTCYFHVSYPVPVCKCDSITCQRLTR